MAVGLLILASGPPPAVAIGSAALLGLGFSFPWTSIISSVLKKTPSNEHGSLVGVLSAFYDLFVGVSSFAAGEVAARFGYPATFVVAAASLLVAGALGVLVFPSGPDVSAVTKEENYLEPVEF
jgi:predicted MFS family arabinose efflux permease